jgi:hypothetical protein
MNENHRLATVTVRVIQIIVRLRQGWLSFLDYSCQAAV